MIPLPSQLKLVKKEGNKAIFEILGLYPGYGVTIGNSLRRVLLSSLEGAAITQVKIKGASHEFSTLPGVLDDVVLILLNLKKLCFKLHTSEPQKGILNVKGERVVRGKDFKLPLGVEIVNPEERITTLTSKSAHLEIEVQIEKGVGYSQVEKREISQKTIGVIPIDAIFTPVRRVAFRVENMIVGKRMDFEKLRIEIETNGVITPKFALQQASDILIKHFSFICNNLEEKKVQPSKSLQKEVKKENVKKKTKLEDLKISQRTLNALKENKIATLEALSRKSEKELLELKGLGEKGLKEIKKILKKAGLKLHS
ncbi:DNA-directed RNA polymerase subunit alpha [bacterium]|nr:DNA-directed RNA polymerase subunit alpha [bacterium]